MTKGLFMRVNLNKKREAHLATILTAFKLFARKKYKRGAREHKEDLWKKTVIDLLIEMRGESIDMFVYTQTAIQNLLLNKIR